MFRLIPRSQGLRSTRRVVVSRDAVRGAIGEQHDDPQARLAPVRNGPQFVPGAIEAFDRERAAAREVLGHIGLQLGLVNVKRERLPGDCFILLWNLNFHKPVGATGFFFRRSDAQQ